MLLLTSNRLSTYICSPNSETVSLDQLCDFLLTQQLRSDVCASAKLARTTAQQSKQPTSRAAVRVGNPASDPEAALVPVPDTHTNTHTDSADEKLFRQQCDEAERRALAKAQRKRLRKRAKRRREDDYKSSKSRKREVGNP